MAFANKSPCALTSQRGQRRIDPEHLNYMWLNRRQDALEVDGIRGVTPLSCGIQRRSASGPKFYSCGKQTYEM